MSFFDSYKPPRDRRGKLKKDMKRPLHPPVERTKQRMKKPKTEFVFDGKGFRSVPDGHDENNWDW